LPGDNQNESGRIFISVPVRLIEQIDSIAKRSFMTRSEFIKSAIAKAVIEHGSNARPAHQALWLEAE
jgi:metal-responsive CopG/Arc/MetJ family transcriptional regulator